MKSIGEPKIQRYLGTEKALKKKDYVKLALDLKLVDKEQLKRGLSEDEVQDVIKKNWMSITTIHSGRKISMRWNIRTM